MLSTNLPQEFVPAVAEQAEGRVVVDCVDCTIGAEEEEAAQGGKHPHRPGVDKVRARGEGDVAF